MTELEVKTKALEQIVRAIPETPTELRPVVAADIRHIAWAALNPHEDDVKCHACGNWASMCSCDEFEKCGATHPSKDNVCDLERGHGGKHQSLTPDGWTYGWDATTGKIEISMTRYPTCFWHYDCAIDPGERAIMKRISRPSTSKRYSVFECTRCGKRGRYPVGGTCVEVCQVEEKSFTCPRCLGKGCSFCSETGRVPEDPSKDDRPNNRYKHG